MKNKNKIQGTLEQEIKQKNDFEDKFLAMISDLYKNHLAETEREDKFILDKLTTAMGGKNLILENSSPKLYR